MDGRSERERERERWTLTVLLVEQYLDLFLLVVLQTRVDPPDRLAIGQLAGHERAVLARRQQGRQPVRARDAAASGGHERAVGASLHQLGAAVAAQLAEAVVAVDRRVVDDARVRQHETAVCTVEHDRVISK